MIASLLMFGHFWGIAGLLMAVPLMASMMMFFNDWLTAKLAAQEAPEMPIESVIADAM
jgi:predicted PurR-regulated permease PerM